MKRRRNKKMKALSNPMLTPMALERNPLDTSKYPKTYTAVGAFVGSALGTIPGALVMRSSRPVGGALAVAGSVIGGAVGGYLLAPADRKSRGAIGGAIGGIIGPLTAGIGGAIGGRKADG
jgi:hypothetical protein